MHWSLFQCILLFMTIMIILEKRGMGELELMVLSLPGGREQQSYLLRMEESR